MMKFNFAVAVEKTAIHCSIISYIIVKQIIFGW